MKIAAHRIGPQTYEIAGYVAFQTDRLSWKMGIPAFADQPLGPYVEGSVIEMSTLKACVARVRTWKRTHKSLRRVGYKWS